jgi:hypothetical protein
MSHAFADTMQEWYEQILEKSAIWVVYTRSDHRFRCIECYNLDTGSSRADCGKCFGTGFKVHLERWFAHYSTTLVRPNNELYPLTKIGFSADFASFIFTRHPLVPVLNDRIFLVEWSLGRDEIAQKGGQPTRLVEALRIRFAEPLPAGKTIYYTAHCDTVSEDRAAYERALFTTPMSATRK